MQLADHAGMTPDENLNRIAQPRGGVFTRGEARASGFTDHAIDHRVHTGLWKRPIPRVLTVGAVAPTPQQLAWVALLGTCDDAVLSHGTAATIHGIGRTQWRAPVRVEVPYGFQPRWAHVGIAVHRSRSLTTEHTVTVGGYTVATLARTVVQCARYRHEAWLRALVADALRRGVTGDDLLTALTDAGKVTGAVLLRQIIETTDPTVARTDSNDEVALLELVLDSDLPRPVPNFEIIDATGRVRARPDLAWPDLLAAAEMDTIAYHGNQNEKTYDLDRQARLEDSLWRFRRFTPDHVRRTPKLVVTRIATMLEQQRATLGALGMLPTLR